jgi:hypothetical protein
MVALASFFCLRYWLTNCFHHPSPLWIVRAPREAVIVFTHFQTIVGNCDAPPYPIVKACRKAGFHSPEDVRWCRLGRFLNLRSRWHDVLSFRFWKWLTRAEQPRRESCSCGQSLPRLVPVSFTRESGEEISYNLGQCYRCRTMFWEGD